MAETFTFLTAFPEISSVTEIPKTFVFILIAALLGVLKEFFITMLVIFPYRAFSGGVHLKTHIGCIAVTSIFYCGTAFVSQFYLFNTTIKYILIFLVWVFGMIMCKLYAPADTESVPILRKKERKIKQILSYITLTITLVIGAVVNNYVISNIIIIGMFVQSIMISRFAYKISKNRYLIKNVGILYYINVIQTQINVYYVIYII